MLDVCTVAELSPDLHFCKLVYIFFKYKARRLSFDRNDIICTPYYITQCSFICQLSARVLHSLII